MINLFDLRKEQIDNDTLKLAGIFEDIIDTLTQIVTNLGILFAIFVINKIMGIILGIQVLTMSDEEFEEYEDEDEGDIW